MGTTQAHHFRKLVAGVCMVVAPVLMIVGMIVHPGLEDTVRGQLATIAADRDRWLVAYLLIGAGLVFTVPVVLGLMHMLRERDPSVGHLGGALGLVGAMAAAGYLAIEGFGGWAAAGVGGGGTVALFERMHDSAATFIPIYLFSYGLVAGMIVLAFGLARRRLVAPWMAACAAIGPLLVGIGVPAASGALCLIGAAVTLIGVGAIGQLVLAESDEEWEHTPEYRGFRPRLGTR